MKNTSQYCNPLVTDSSVFYAFNAILFAWKRFDQNSQQLFFF